MGAAGMTDIDQQRLRQTIAWNGKYLITHFILSDRELISADLDGGPNNQSMQSQSSANSVIVPGEKNYQQEIKLQMKI